VKQENSSIYSTVDIISLLTRLALNGVGKYPPRLMRVITQFDRMTLRGTPHTGTTSDDGESFVVSKCKQISQHTESGSCETRSIYLKRPSIPVLSSISTDLVHLHHHPSAPGQTLPRLIRVINTKNVYTARALARSWSRKDQCWRGQSIPAH
jgi:hypothetical protein